MNGASKILTVSYGTFSCTLEGFDDPFNTMRAIAEYFRDLAADDRYFGAEPPIPDAAMLHRIAEHEIQRRVEAKIQDNGVVLRAEEASPPRVTMPGMTHVAPVVVQTSPTLASAAEASQAVESAAARLSRLRAAQAQIISPAPAAFSLGDISSRFADVQAYAEDQDAETPAKPVVTPAPAPIRSSNISDQQPAVVAAPEAPTFAPVAEVVAEVPAEMIAPVDQVAAAPAPQSSDDAMTSLRETLAGLIAQDDQLAEDMASSAPSDLASAEALPEDHATPAEFDAEIEDFDQSDVNDLAILDGATPNAVEPEVPVIDDAAYLGDEDEAAAPEAEAPADAREVEPLAALNANSDQTDQISPQGDNIDAEPEVAVAPGSPVGLEKIQRARARVIKVRRLDTKPEATAVADTAAPPPAVAEPPVADAADLPPSTVEPALLSPEAEADLQIELAALEAELGPVTTHVPDEAATAASLETVEMTSVEVHVETTVEEQVETKLTVTAADDAAVDRLLAQTNSNLEVPETKRRRSAIAHLKAAVLATVADRKINPTAKTKVAEVKMDPYRKDLDQAVRPSTVPSDRPAPLVLVSAQRIDRKRDAVADANRPMPQIVPSSPAPQPSMGQTVRPRRVTSGVLAQAVSANPIDDEEEDEAALEPQENIFADGSKQNFADFAESLGATSLAELIEAAGAYCTLVLARPSFTRPLLFQQISSMPELADLNREESLRGFGKLLREGRIEKTVRGQFALSATSPLLTEAKRIAG